MLAGSLVHLPIAALETSVFSILLYFMTGLAEEAGRWFYFWGMLTLTNMAMGAMFRVFSYALKDLEAAQTAPGPIISLQGEAPPPLRSPAARRGNWSSRGPPTRQHNTPTPRLPHPAAMHWGGRGGWEVCA